MKRKIMLLLSFFCFLTGCDANYKIEYTNDIVKETLEINDLSAYEKEVRDVYSFDLSTNYLDVSDYTKEEGLVHGYTYYDKQLSNQNTLSLIYKYNFTKDEYANSQIAHNAFSNLKFSSNVLNSGMINDIFTKYPDLNMISIEFTTDKFVSYTNADKVVDDKYYWYFERDRSQDKFIKIMFSEEDTRDFVEILKDETKNIEDKQFDQFFKYFFIVLGVIILVVIFFVSVKFKNSNKK